MLGKGLESLIPKKEGDSREAPEETGRPPAPALPAGRQGHGDLDSHRDSETFPTALPESHKDERMQQFQATAQTKRETKADSIFHIEVEKIKPNPHQPRRNFNEESLKELASSIMEFGVIQPLTVSKIETEGENGTLVEYELIAGERRLIASRMAGLRTVPVIVRRPSLEREKLELAVIENVQRADLNPIEIARSFARLQDEFRLTQREIASRLGKSREAVSNSVRLLNLPSEIQAALAEGKLNEGQARLLLGIDDVGEQKAIFDEILRDNLSVREVRARVKKLTSKDLPEITITQKASIDPNLIALKERLEEFFGTNIDLDQKGASGKITISFYSPEELNAIVDKLLKQNDNQSL